MRERITQAEFARRHNVTRQAIHDLVTRGVILLVDGLVDEDQAMAAIETAHDPARASKILLISGPTREMDPAALTPPPTQMLPEPPTDIEATSFHQARTRRELAEAKRAELRLELEQAELVELALVIATWGNLLATLRTRLLAIPASPEIPEHVREGVRRRIADALHELADHDPGHLVTPP